MSEIYMALLSVSPTQVKVTRFTSQVGDEPGRSCYFDVSPIVFDRFNPRFQFETTWSASINILLAAA